MGIKLTSYFSQHADFNRIKQADVRVPHSNNQKLKTFITFLNQHQFPYFLLYGTALGIYRDQKIIEGDWDIDIGFLAQDIQKLKALLRQLEPQGFILESIHEHSNICLYLTGCGDFHMDLYIIKPANFFYRLLGKKWLCAHAYFKQDYFNQEKRTWVDIHGTPYSCPAQAETYLEEVYGPAWRTPQKNASATYRGFLSQCINYFIMDAHVPLKFSLHGAYFKPWANALMTQFFPKFTVTHRYKRPIEPDN